jgi:hypothetical protein
MMAAALAAGMLLGGACRKEPMSYQSMLTCYERPPVEMMLGGETRTMIVPRVRRGRLEVLSVFSSWSPQLGNNEMRPREIVVADAEENEFVAREPIAAAALEGVSRGAVPSGPATFSEMKGVFDDMDRVLMDFARGHQPTAPDAVAARDRLRSAYPRTIPPQHLVVYQRLSPAWFAFLDGDAAFAEKHAP